MMVEAKERPGKRHYIEASRVDEEEELFRVFYDGDKKMIFRKTALRDDGGYVKIDGDMVFP